MEFDSIFTLNGLEMIYMEQSVRTIIT